MKANGECIYGCDYAGLEKQSWGYYTKNKKGEVYMIVFNRPCSNLLKVVVPSKTVIKKATVLNHGETKFVETTRNQYNVALPAQLGEGPWVIKLQMKGGEGQKGEYREALT